MNPIMFSSAKQDWRTPRWLFDRLHAEFRFTLDAAANEENALCERYFTETDDALSHAWTGRFFLNPPYGRGVGQWVRYAWEQVYVHGHADIGVVLIASRTDTRFWHQYALRGAEIRMVEGRLHFDDGSAPATFPSAVLVFDRWKAHPVAWSTIKPPQREASSSMHHHAKVRKSVEGDPP